MNHRSLLGSAAMLALATMVGGCSSTREVEVTGNVSAAQGVSTGAIVLEFYDLIGEGEEMERVNVHSVTLQAPGEFSETVDLEGEKVLIRAIADGDADGKCTAGEAWGELEVAISEDKAADAAVEITSQSACPAE